MKTNRLLIIGIPLIIVLAALVVYQYGYLRVHSEIASIREEELIKTKTLEKYISLIQEGPELEETLEALKEKRKDYNSKLVEGQTASLAAGGLQDTLKNIIISSGGTVSTVRVGKPEALGNYKIISLSLDAVLPDSRSLTEIFHSIETMTPYVVIKEVDARVRSYNNPKELALKLDMTALTSGM